MKLKTTKAYKEDLRSGSTGGAGIAKEYVSTCKQIGPEEDRTLEFCITTDSVDRHGDTVASKGWKTAAYEGNPVVLFGHDYDALPVGKSGRISPFNHGLRSQVKFAPANVHPFAEQVYQLCKGGFLNAASVGFIPLSYEEADREGYYPMDIKEQELLEWSIVPVPANGEALIGASAAGIDLNVIKQWAERALSKATRNADDAAQVNDAAQVVAIINAMCDEAGLPPTAKSKPGDLNLSESDVRAICESAMNRFEYLMLGRVRD